MSERKEAVSPESPPEEVRGASRRQFLGSAAVAAVAVSGASTLLAACGESSTGPSEATRGATTPGPRANLGGGPDPGVTLHKMMVATLGAATDVRIPALEKGIKTTYLQRVITDNDRTGTGLSTVLKKNYAFTNGPTVQVVVQDSFGRAWAPRQVLRNADLAFAMKDALATNPQHAGVLKVSVESGPVVALSKSSVIAFQDSAKSDYYGNHLDLVSGGFSDIFNPSVSGIAITSTMRDLNRC